MSTQTSGKKPWSFQKTRAAQLILIPLIILSTVTLGYTIYAWATANAYEHVLKLPLYFAQLFASVLLLFVSAGLLVAIRRKTIKK